MTIGTIICFIAIFIAIGIFIYLFINIFLSKSLTNKSVLIIMISLTISLTIVSFFLKSYGDHDLVRHLELIEELKDKNLTYLFTDFKYNTEPLTALWFFFVAKINCPNLITTLPTLISIGIIGYICFDIYRSREKKAFNNFCLIFLVLFSFIEIIMILTTVRYWTAASIILLALYRDIYKHKRNWLTILLYLLSLMVHNFVIILLFIRLLSILNYKYFCVVFLFSYLIMMICSKILIITNIGECVEIGNLLYAYLKMESIDYRYVLCTSLFLVVLLTIFVINYIVRYKFEKKEVSLKHFFNCELYKQNRIAINYSLTTIGFIFSSHLIRRLNLVTMFLSFPYLYDTLNFMDDNKEISFIKLKLSTIKKIIVVGFCIITIGMMIYQAFGWKLWGLTCIN